MAGAALLSLADDAQHLERFLIGRECKSSAAGKSRESFREPSHCNAKGRYGLAK
jgi:hypothetical protein